MMTTAHPDDENNAMLAYFSHGKGFRTTLVTATHGEGGQNEIGPELFVPLAVLRTEELAGGASVRWRGAVLHARDRFRVLVQHRRDAREVGPPGDSRRLRADDPHDPSRRDRRLRVRRRGRRPAPPDVVAADARSISRGGRPGAVPRADQGRAAPVAGVEVLLHGRLRAGPVRSGCMRPLHQVRRRLRTLELRGRRCVRSDSRTHLQRDRRRGAQHAQVPGHVAVAAAAGAHGRRWIRRRTDGPRRHSRLSPARHRAGRRRCAQRARDVRRRRYQPPQLVAIRRRECACGSRRLGSTRSRQRSRKRVRRWPPAARRGSRAARSRTESSSRLARCVDRARSGGPLRDRLPPGAEGRRSSSRRCCSPPMCGSKRSPATASCRPVSRSACS